MSPVMIVRRMGSGSVEEKVRAGTKKDGTGEGSGGGHALELHMCLNLKSHFNQ
jgi:hypothetical protein